MAIQGTVGEPFVVFASEARTATATSSVYRNPGTYRGVLLWIATTAITATPSVTFAIQDSSGVTDAFATVVASSAITAADVEAVLVVHPSVVDSANLSENGPLANQWRVLATHGDADSITYQVLAWPLK